MRILGKFLMISSLLSLVGCSSYQEQFDCPPGSGVGCKSLSDVDQLVESGKLPIGSEASLEFQENDQQSLDKNAQKDCSCEKSSPQEKIQKGERENLLPPVEITIDQSPSPSSLKNPDSWEIERKGEEVIRVWIAPHEDELGNYYSGSYLYSVLTPGTWEKKE